MVTDTRETGKQRLGNYLYKWTERREKTRRQENRDTFVLRAEHERDASVTRTCYTRYTFVLRFLRRKILKQVTKKIRIITFIPYESESS